MLKTVQDISQTKKRLTIEIPADALEGAYQKSLAEARLASRLPGFRPGKAPAPLVERKFGKQLEADVVERMIPEYYSAALKDAGLSPVAMPSIENEVKFRRNEPLGLTMLVEVRPKIEPLSYDGLSIKRLPAEVTDQDVDSTLQRLREDKAQVEPSEEPVKDGDVAIVTCAFKESGKSYQDEVFRMDGKHIPEAFYQGLLGMKKGETREFPAEFSADYHITELAGVKDICAATVTDVKTVKLPALDDEFAKDLEFDDMAALRAHVRERLTKSKDNVVRRLMKAEAVRKLVEGHELEAPESLVKAELDHMASNAKFQGDQRPDEDVRAELAPRAVESVKASMLLEAIADKENIEAAEDEVRRRVMELAAQAHLTPENIMKYYISRDGSLDGLRGQVREEKVMDLLLERARMEEPAE